nr:hypothetical protein [Tanacetum cinerariifolium]
LAVLLVGFGSLYLLYSALKFLSMFSIDGLTLKGGKLEATHHGSVLHKNVDEIIYCFERSDIRVVVIEDLDRFGTQEIFFRLREINFTIRHSPQVRRPIHFIYAIREELFTVADKTKFFDLIIPVIPVVNSENSREKLYELMGRRTVGREALQKEKAERERAIVQELEDLRSLVWFEMVKSSQVEGVNYIRIDRGQQVDLNAFVKEETFDAVCKASRLEVVSQSYRPEYGLGVSPEDVLARASYEKRANQIKRSLSEIEDSAKPVEQSILKLKGLSFHEAADGEYGEVIRDVLTQKLGMVLRDADQHLERLAEAAVIILNGEARDAFIRGLYAIDSGLFVKLLGTDLYSDRVIRQSF